MRSDQDKQARPGLQSEIIDGTGDGIRDTSPA
jgi:hypothetical protein